MRYGNLALLGFLLLGGCHATNAFLYSCAPPDATRTQRVNQVMTLVTLDRLAVALPEYARRCGGYPNTLEALLAPEEGRASNCKRSGIYAEVAKRCLSPGALELETRHFGVLATSGVDRGYRLSYRPTGALPGGHSVDYSLAADPVERDETAFESFWMRSDGDIHGNRSRPANERDDAYHSAEERRRTTGCS